MNDTSFNDKSCLIGMIVLNNKQNTMSNYFWYFLCKLYLGTDKKVWSKLHKHFCVENFPLSFMQTLKIEGISCEN